MSQEVVEIPQTINLIPIEIDKSDGNERGWDRLSVETAIANTHSQFRLFIIDCAGNREVSVTSSESREESVNWWFDSDCTIITLPPGIIVRNPSNIAGQIPAQVTGIELDVPYSDFQMDAFPTGAIASNKRVKLNLNTDLTKPESINFPVYDKSLLNANEMGEDFELEAGKVRVETFAENVEGDILAQIRLANTNSLDNSQFDRIRVMGAGSDGVLREAEKSSGQCQPPLVGNQRLDFQLPQIGPSQRVTCNFKFSDIPTNINNFHIWFTLYERGMNEYNIIDSGVFRFGDFAESNPTNDTVTNSNESVSLKGDANKGEMLYRQTFLGDVPAPGCITCHHIDENEVLVGPSHIGIGTRAASAVEGLSAEEYLRQSIIEPNAHITDGFVEGIMYQNYADELSDKDIDDLVAFLLQQ